jgi:tetratricopeptide (TPR) repeat protein
MLELISCHLVVDQAYSNRAACYTKLGAFPEGLKDANKCIELDPSFAKGYSRKGTIQFFMKEYDKALETYQTGLKYNEGNQELMDGARRYVCVHIYAFLNSSSISNVNNLEVGMCLNRNL